MGEWAYAVISDDHYQKFSSGLWIVFGSLINAHVYGSGGWIGSDNGPGRCMF